MTLPPPPDPYGSQPPQGGGQPGGGVPPQWGSQQGGVPPQGFGGGYGPPPQGPWGPQQQWPGGPGGQPPKSGRGKWILGGIAVVLAIALAVVITVLVVRPADGGGGNGDPTQQNGDSEFASADDTGPVNIITEDPTCGAWGDVVRVYADASSGVEWGERDFSVPASAWTPEQRTMYETVGDAMSDAARKAENLATQTPHRVMRQLYEQFIAYANAFVERIPSYSQEDDNLAVVTDTIATGAADICSAIEYGSAAPIAPLIPSAESPTTVAPTNSSDEQAQFLSNNNPVCQQWESVAQRFNDETSAWRALDSNLSAKEWTPDQRALVDSVSPIMSRTADEFEQLGRDSGNAVLEDFATLSAQYARGYVAALPNYTPNDNLLYKANARLVKTVSWACKAAQ